MLQPGLAVAGPNLLSPLEGGMVNFGNADKDLTDEFKTLEEQLLTMPDGRQVRHSEREPFYGILSGLNDEHYLANPIGTITVHVIHAKKLDTRTVSRIFPGSSSLDYYVRIDHAEKQYFSKLCVDVALSEPRIIFDHLITFSVDDIVPNEGSEMQTVTFNLMAVEEGDPHRHIVIGKAEKLLTDFIRNMVASEILQLSKPAKVNESDGGYEGERHMATLLVKSAFAYGRFGYGYSNQIFDDRTEPADAIKHSMYPRYSPPSGRTQEAGRVLRFRPVRPLDILPATDPAAHVGNPLLRIDRTTQDEEDVVIGTAIPWINPSLKYVPALCKDRFKEWSDKMSKLKSTTQRVEYLKKICTACPTTEICYSAKATTKPGLGRTNLTSFAALPDRLDPLPEVLVIE